MNLIVCVDDKNGMMFHNRRQSQDRVLREKIVSETANSRLWMNSYSHRQFSLAPASNAAPSSHISIDEDFLQKASSGDYCFVEDQSVASYESIIDEIILYKWNRSYPADRYFDIPLKENGWNLTATEDFAGSSHEKITKEVYRR